MTASIMALVAGLQAEQPQDRVNTAEKLARMAAAAQPAAVALVKAMGDQHDEVKDWATAALEELGPPAEGDAKALAELLADSQPDVAFWAATLLGRLDAQGSAAVPALTAALQNRQDLPVRQKIAWALGQIGDIGESRAALEQAAKDADSRLSRLAQQALQKFDGGK
ncbi:MAG: HEAT repeat domain-containing protein [Pirellulales bacterium]